MEASIPDIFSNIPAKAILQIASDVQRRILSDPSIIGTKEGNQSVTEADHRIQKLLLDYFDKSALAGSYSVQAEEALDRICEYPRGKKWHLIIDPLDGTSSFCKGEDQWGTMVGLCNLSGRLIYSWNLLSDGRIYTSSDRSAGKTPKENSNRITIDFHDYGEGLQDRFLQCFAQREAAPEIICADSAVWAGWSLIEGSADGLLWLPSPLGKGFYPDYDLVFLGALPVEKWSIAIGRQDSQVRVLAVAADKRMLDNLWNCALTIIGKQQASRIIHETEFIVHDLL